MIIYIVVLMTIKLIFCSKSETNVCNLLLMPFWVRNFAMKFHFLAAEILLLQDWNQC